LYALVMIEVIRPTILEKTGASKILDIQLIQELWSGYGELNRVLLDNGSVILKLIKLVKLKEKNDHPRGWNSNIGHIRKKTSYEVETTWYQNFNSPIDGAILPKHIASGNIGEYQYLILEDLKSRKLHPKSSANWEEVKNCLSWLAHFHRSFLGAKVQGLWPIGTYWHLDTRPEELEALTDLELKEAAPLIDSKLNRAKFKTIVHGDAKLANFLFTKDLAAAVDFQYVGGGVGVKDVAYFLSSVFREEDLEELETQCLDYYFKILDHPEVETEWRELYPYAWCDFYRFLQGWSPGHWKINSYSEEMKQKVLKCL
jgi:hypothetical protein